MGEREGGGRETGRQREREEGGGRKREEGKRWECHSIVADNETR